MKKLMLLTSAAALALASCSDDEMKDVNRGRAIDFRAETASRASETTAANLETFYASAYDGAAVYEGFSDVLFENHDGFFYSQTSYYWPEDADKTLSFVAYAPATTANGGVVNGTMTHSANGFTLAGFAPRYDVAKQVDFVHAKATGSKNVNEKSGVSLNFNHALSQVEIKAKNGGNNKCTIAGIKIVGVYNAADYDMAAGWTTTDKTKGSYKVTYDDPVVLKNNTTEVSLMGEAGTAMLVPQQLTAWDTQDHENAAGGAYIAVKLNLKDNADKLIFPRDNNEDAYGWVAIPISTKWEAGKKYVYTLDFATGAGVVAPSTGGENQYDPGQPGDKDDKDHPLNDDDESNDNGDEDEQNPGGGGTGDDPSKDPDIPGTGDLVVETPIRFSVTISGWTNVSSKPNMSL